VLVSAAQAHAALALAIRTGMASDFGNHAEPAQGSKLPGSLTGPARTCTPATSLLAEVRPGPDDARVAVADSSAHRGIIVAIVASSPRRSEGR
jgi:hypothetical protein